LVLGASPSLVAVMIWWLSASSIPGWLLAVLGLAVIPLGIRATVKQKRRNATSYERCVAIG
jgi:hypothetical protein